MKIKDIKVDWEYLPYNLPDVVAFVLCPFISYIVFSFIHHIYLYLNIFYFNIDIYFALYYVVCLFPLIYLAVGFAIGYKRQHEDVIYGFCDGCYVTIDGSTHFKQSNTVCPDCKLKDKK